MYYAILVVVALLTHSSSGVDVITSLPSLALPAQHLNMKAGVHGARDIVIFAGGTNSGRIDILNVSSRIWLPPTLMGGAQFRCSVAAGRYVFFACQGSFVSFYDMDNSTWLYEYIGGGMQTAVTAAFVIGDIAHFMSTVTSPETFALTRFNVSSGTWLPIVPTPGNYSARAPCAVVGDLAFFGHNASTIGVFDARSLTWREPLTLSRVRNSYGLVAAAGILFVAGGASNSEFDVYDVAAQQWLALLTPPRPLTQTYAGIYQNCFASNDLVVCAPYKNNLQSYPIALIYNASARQWLPMTFVNASGYYEFVAFASVQHYVFITYPDRAYIFDTTTGAFVPFNATPAPAALAAQAVPTPAALAAIQTPSARTPTARTVPAPAPRVPVASPTGPPDGTRTAHASGIRPLLPFLAAIILLLYMF